MHTKNLIESLNKYLELRSKMVIIKSIITESLKKENYDSYQAAETLLKAICYTHGYFGLDVNGDYRINDYNAIYDIINKYNILNNEYSNIKKLLNRLFNHGDITSNECIREVFWILIDLEKRGLI
ncbi:hypothetical protein HMPREF0072_0829 [Anaerococcus lactolyticus ATCC 51172]|uniref:Uncharacterized protein n=1 Tax=Anaerococcus lactolyticus ATCC 51172 TaxID=525254 RepID=C2BEQ9_9FIRM|nr:hypothetical protein [Anaerococcus lactolyticus]EEI86571.1 hypothetical protein HMPREF0072_0829 [Anaerococcus lactolyticus ATCC 51172]